MVPRTASIKERMDSNIKDNEAVCDKSFCKKLIIYRFVCFNGFSHTSGQDCDIISAMNQAVVSLITSLL